MAITRIKNNQITDSTINAASKVQDFSVTGGKLANALTYGSDFTVTGNLTVQGTTTSIDTTTTTVEDPVLLLASDQTGAASTDIGFLGERGDDTNIAFVWDESADEFVAAFTSDADTAAQVTVSSYANFKALDIAATGNIDVTGDATIGGAFTVTGNITGGNLISNAAIEGVDVTASGVVTATGNVTGGNLVTAGDVTTATVTASGAITSDSLTATGNVQGGNLVSDADVTTVTVTASGAISSATTITATGNVTGGNLVTGGDADVTGAISAGTTIDATGNVTGGNLVTAGTMDSATINTTGEATLASATVSDLTSGRVVLAGTSGAIEDSTNLTFDGSTLGVTGAVTASTTITATGNITGGNIASLGAFEANSLESTTSISAGTTIDATGNITGGNLVTAGDVTTATVTASGAIAGSTTITATGNVTGGNVITAGAVESASVDASGAISAGTTIDATGNVTGGNLVTAGDVTTATVTASGAIAGSTTITATGNVTGGNLKTAGAVESASVDASGAVVADTIEANTSATLASAAISDLTDNRVVIAGTSGELEDDANFTFDGSTVALGGSTDLTVGGATTVTGNVTGGNLITAGAVEADSLDVTNNALVGGTLTITGNLTVQGTTTTVDSQTTVVEDPVFRIGTSGLSTDDGKDRGIEFIHHDGTGNFTGFFGYDDDAEVFTFIPDATNTNEVFTGTAGNVVFHDGDFAAITASETITATGNITGGNIISLGSFEANTLDSTTSITAGTTIDATGNITGGNLVTAGTTDTDTLDVTNNATVGGTAIVTGNVTGGNLITAGAVESASVDASGAVVADTIEANTSATLASAAVSDLTDTRIVFAGAGGELTDNAGLTTTGTTLTATGNITGGNLVTAGDVDAATGTIATLDGTTATFTGNVQGGNLVSDADVTTVTVTASGAISTDTTVDATGNITGGNLVTAGDVDAATGTIATLDGTTATFTGNVTGGNLITAGALEANSIDSTTSIDAGTTITATGNVTGGNLVTAGDVTTATVTASGAIAGSTTITATGNVIGGNLVTAGAVEGDSLDVTNNATIGGTATVTGNVTGGNLVTAGTMDSATINTTGEATLASATVSDLTDNRVVIAGTSGALEDDANFTFDGSTMTVSADASITGTADVQTGLMVGDVAANLTSGATLEVAGTDSILVPVGTTAQRPGTPVTGMIRFNTTLDQFEFYDNDSWTTAGSEFTVIASESFNGDGSTVAYTLSDEQTTASCVVSINGVVQVPTTAYAVSGTTLTFTEAPLSGDVIEVRKLTTTSTLTQLAASDGTAIYDAIGGGVANITISGNVIGSFDSSGLTINGTLSADSITGIDSDQISNGTSNVSIATSGGNVGVAVAGNAIANFTADGLMPNANVAYDLGSSSLMWRDVYVGPGSLFINGQKVLESNPDQDIIITADNDQTLKVQSKGTGDIEFSATGTGTVQFKSDVTMAAGVSLVSADANPVDFSNGVAGGNVQISGNQITNGATDQNLVLSGNGAGVVSVTDDMTISGNLTVSGTTTTVNSTNTTIADALLLLSDGTSGAPLKDSGLIVERGSSTNVGMVWDESADEFAMVNTPDDATTAGDITISSYANLQVNTLTGTSTQAQYADLAENYSADADYEPGTVVVFGGDAEVTLADEADDHRVAGVITTAPAYLMNSHIEADHIAGVAFTGRVPCKVTGTVKKGDLMVSAGNGMAKANNNPAPGTIIGKALENSEGDAVIEVVVGRF